MIDRAIVLAAQPLLKRGAYHSKSRYRIGHRPSDKGRNAPVANTVDELLQAHGITWANKTLYLAYIDAIFQEALL